MTSEHQAFLNAIIAQPENDLPRLVFADFLEESGEPALVARAQYIRCEIELAKGGLSESEGKSHRQRSNTLRQLFQDELELRLQQRPQILARLEYVRGFPEVMRADWYSTLRLGGELPVLAPIRQLQIFERHPLRIPPLPSESPFEEPEPSITTQSFFPALERLILHSLHDHFIEALTAIVRHFTIPRLRALEILSTSLDENFALWFITQIQNSTFAKSLRELDLSWLRFTDRIAHTLAAARGLEELTLLRLHGTAYSEEAKDLLVRRFGARVEFDS